MSQSITVDDMKKCFIPQFDIYCLSIVKLPQSDFDSLLSSCISGIKSRGKKEKKYWEAERKTIQSYTKNQAIEELIKAKRIDEKIRQIDHYIRRISRA